MATAAVLVGVAVVGAVISAAGSIMQGQAQAQAQRQAGEQQAAIAAQQAAMMQNQAIMQQQQQQQALIMAQYNAEIQRQNAEVAYQMQVYQATVNANIAKVQAATAATNKAYVEAQQIGVKRQYEWQMRNAEEQAKFAEQIRAQGREEANRAREENEKRVSLMRAKVAKSGVTFEGSPLVILSDAAKLAETQAQDIAYKTELESRKQLRIADIEKMKSYGYLMQNMGLEAEAANYEGEIQRRRYEESLFAFDKELAGVRRDIANREADLTEMAGQARAYGIGMEAWSTEVEAGITEYKGRAAQAQGQSLANASLIGAGFDAAGAIVGGIGQAYS